MMVGFGTGTAVAGRRSLARGMAGSIDQIDQLSELWSRKSGTPRWGRCKPDGFGEVHWTYSAYAPKLACNGIRIGSVEGDRFREPEVIDIGESSLLCVRARRCRFAIPM